MSRRPSRKSGLRPARAVAIFWRRTLTAGFAPRDWRADKAHVVTAPAAVLGGAARSGPLFFRARS